MSGRRFPTDLMFALRALYCKFGISYRDLRRDEERALRRCRSHDAVPLGSNTLRR